MRIFFGSVRVFGALCLLCLAQNPAKANEEKDPCPKPRSAKDILDCVMTRHPDIQRLNASVLKKQAGEKTAAQRPNPELEARALFGTERAGETISEINLFHPWELGGKRSARIGQARAEVESLQADRQKVVEEKIIETVVGLHRLRQIRLERSLLDENIAAYRHIVTLFKNRPLLSPEQETSGMVFQLAADENVLKKTELLNEESRLKNFIKKSTDLEIAWTPSLLPSSPASWPAMEDNETSTLEGVASMKKAQAELKEARAKHSRAKSEAWPTLKLGPSMETESPLGDTQASLGFALSTSLPIYQRNAAAKKEAALEEKAAELNLTLTQKENQFERSGLIEEYRRSVKVYREAKGRVAFEKKHKNLEDLFERGLIPSGFMLEAHRQMFEFKRQLHKSELDAIQALWKIHSMSGRILEERL